MKNIGFIIPNYENENRRALLPEDVYKIKGYKNIYVEQNYGKILNIDDEVYEKAGCVIETRENIYKLCDSISHLKLILESDYPLLRDNQVLIGWTHPAGSGKEFMKIANEKKLVIVDLDNILPCMYYNQETIQLIPTIPKNFIYKNSINAGRAAVLHAFISCGIYPSSKHKVAVLSAGNVSQGAIEILNKFSCDIRIFTRSNMNEFYNEISTFDVIVNGIEISPGGERIISKEDSKKIKKGALVIDAAADAGDEILGGAVELSRFTTFENPIRVINDVNYWCINNIPTLFFKSATEVISESFSNYAYSLDYKKILRDNNISK